MPRSIFLRKTLKTVCVDTVLFFAMFALVGHLTINFWERYTIQSELTTMKHSLHSLKDTITNIGKAYDTLHIELKDLFTIVDKKQMMMPECMKQETDRCKEQYNLDRKKLHDLQVQTVITKSNRLKVGVGVATDNNKYTESHGREHKATGPLGIHATTNTKNPPKSTGITSDMSKYEKDQYTQNDSKRVHSYHTHLRCYNDLEHCRHVCHRAKIR